MLIVLLSSIGLSTLMGIMVRKAQGRKLEEDS